MVGGGVALASKRHASKSCLSINNRDDDNNNNNNHNNHKGILINKEPPAHALTCQGLQARSRNPHGVVVNVLQYTSTDKTG